MLKQQGLPLPARLQKSKSDRKPKLKPWMKFYLSAFADLSSERSFGMSPGPIPVSQILHWAVRNRLTRREFEKLKYLIVRLDKTWMKWWEKESKKNDSKKAGK